MKFLRKNGGSIYGLNSEIGNETSLKYSAIGDNVQAFHCDVFQSFVDNSFIISASINNSTLSKTRTVNSDIVESKLENCDIVWSQIYKCRISSAILHNVYAKDCNITSDSVIKNCRLIDMDIFDRVYMDGGEWTRVPRSFVLNTKIAKNVLITEGANETAFIGCVNKPIKIWLRGATKFCKIVGWGQEEKETIEKVLQSWL